MEPKEQLIIAGLAALVANQTARMNGEISLYGALQWDPRTPEVVALEQRLIEAGAYSPASATEDPKDAKIRDLRFALSGMARAFGREHPTEGEREALDTARQVLRAPAPEVPHG